ncbi:MAG TPA: ethylbenzene dehydrogenase-related protein [Gammaproteobacteria bacterium]|mgnify:CR=1 FL=1|nr:ethylbenzene dehydrogenase-related protein [Gammaproteobacteria bacterium]
MLTDYTREIRALTACGAFLLLQSAAAQAASTDTPAAIVIVAHAIAQNGAFTAGSDPRAALWARVPEEEIELKLAPPVHPAIALNQAAVKTARALPLHVSALTDHRRLYLRLRWKDRTHDDRRATGLFPDAAAVEVPIAATDTAVMMGTPDKPVAIWRWDAAKNEVEALAAGSPGTLTPAVDDGLRGSGSYRELGDAASNEWCVVIARDLEERGEARLDLRARKRFPAAFAIWQGSDGQRGGFKHVSDWVSVRLPD